MIFKFRIVSDEVANFKREINIDASATFLELKNAICDSVNFDKGQMSSFFLCSDGWEKLKEITFEDMMNDSDEEVLIMDECELGDYLEDEGQKLIFVFDYMTDRCMFMELRDIVTGKTLQDPICTLAAGTPPAQNIDLDEFTKSMDDKAAAAIAAATIEEMDDEFYGSDEYSDEELEAGGYSDFDFDS